MWSSQAFRDGCSLLEQQNAATTPLVPTGGGGVGRWGQRRPAMASVPMRNRHIQQFASGFSYRKKSQSENKTPTLSVFFSNSRYLKVQLSTFDSPRQFHMTSL
ncbi:hypothetical protein DdX_01224 [Ditylenchus destructor]|uniref:Uncharacterized protein n=1 Tax=Ditylenchus destructor TaxID=166010 RepID=A0AAD4NLE2_9BILA|nr:hypothetical protein DdX_01224 [Ditylenchus destructor]